MKAAESFFTRTQRKDELAKTLRDELRVEIAQLRSRIEALEEQVADKEKLVDMWREKYYAAISKQEQMMKDVSAQLDGINNHIDRIHGETNDTRAG